MAHSYNQDGVDPPGAELCVFFCIKNSLNRMARSSAAFFVVFFGCLNAARGSAANTPVEARGAALRLIAVSGMMSGLPS
jgi:hypothetical protein